MANTQISTIPNSPLLNLPLDVLFIIDDILEQEEPSAQLAFRLSCKPIYKSLRPCMLENLPKNYNPYLRPHVYKFLQLIQDENLTPCGKCYRAHNIRNVLRHPTWRDPSPCDYVCERAAGTFNLCPCINITATDGFFLWCWSFGHYGISGATDPATGPMAEGIPAKKTFLHRCRGPSHPLFSQYDIAVVGYSVNVSPTNYHRAFGSLPKLRLIFDIEYRFNVISPPEPLDEDAEIDTIKLCPHMRLIYWDAMGNHRFDIKKRCCVVCNTAVTTVVEDQTTLVVKVSRIYGDSLTHCFPYKTGVEGASPE